VSLRWKLSYHTSWMFRRDSTWATHRCLLRYRMEDVL
jgi:hypothetical protein